LAIGDFLLFACACRLMGYARVGFGWAIAAGGFVPPPGGWNACSSIAPVGWPFGDAAPSPAGAAENTGQSFHVHFRRQVPVRPGTGPPCATIRA
jgi:hypothetical protein